MTIQAGPIVQIDVILVSILGLWISARLLVDAVGRLARQYRLSDLTIGPTIVAMGTSTPEFAASLIAISRESLGGSIRNVVGSNIYTITGT